MGNIDIGGQQMRNALLWSGDIVSNTEVIPGKNVVLCNVLYGFFCNSGQFSFFHVLLNEKHSIYSRNLPFLQFFVGIQWYQMEMSEYFAWI
jgi:hypothetical protein